MNVLSDEPQHLPPLNHSRPRLVRVREMAHTRPQKLIRPDVRVGSCGRRPGKNFLTFCSIGTNAKARGCLMIVGFLTLCIVVGAITVWWAGMLLFSVVTLATAFY